MARPSGKAADQELRGLLESTIALKHAMETMLDASNPNDVWRYAGYREFTRKYMQVVEEVSRHIILPSTIDGYNLEKIPRATGTIAIEQKELFEGVHANLALLKSHLEVKLGVVDDNISEIRDFIQSRLRSSMHDSPEREVDVQNALEVLLIGRGLEKGQDYDRESGRVKISSKEAIPDFVLLKLSLAVEVKLLKRRERVSEAVDEINADIAAYGKRYRNIIFVVYDTGFIRDEAEFRRDLENAPNVNVLVIKH